MDKVEIIAIARKIGTYDTSILPFEDCCTIFTPKSPATKPRLDRCLEYEKKWDWQSMVDDCIENASMVRITPASAASASTEEETVDEDLF